MDITVVIARDEDYLIDALCLELVEVLNVGRQVSGAAGRGEGAGDGDEDDLFVLELLAGVVLDAEAAGCEVELPGWGDVREGNVGREGVAWFET